MFLLPVISPTYVSSIIIPQEAQLTLIFQLFFQFYSHNYLFLDTEQESSISSRSNSNGSTQTVPLPTMVTSTILPHSSSGSTSSLSGHEEKPKMNNTSAVILLVIVTVLAYVTSEYLVDSLDGMVAAHPKISKEWITLTVIPIISNAAEHTTAVIVASKGKFDLAMSVAVGSCIQISLFVIPFLVLLSWIMGKPLTMLFDPLETLVCHPVFDRRQSVLIMAGFIPFRSCCEILSRRWQVTLDERNCSNM